MAATADKTLTIPPAAQVGEADMIALTLKFKGHMPMNIERVQLMRFAGDFVDASILTHLQHASADH